MRPVGAAPPWPPRPPEREPDVPEDARAGPLRSGTSLDVLARIVPDDVLGLRARLARLLERRALLVDVEPLLLRAQALVALHAPAWRGAPPLGDWLEERATEALESVLAEEGQGTDAVRRLRSLAASLALDPRSLGCALSGFNRLPFEVRDVFVRVVLEGEGADGLARSRGLGLAELARRVRAALGPLRALVEGAGPGSRASSGTGP
jgi:hypothetical protein